MIFYFKCFGMNFAKTIYNNNINGSLNIPRTLLFHSEMIMKENGIFTKSRTIGLSQDLFKLELKVNPIRDLDQLTREELVGLLESLKISYYNYLSKTSIDNSPNLTIHAYADRTSKIKKEIPQVKKGIHKE